MYVMIESFWRYLDKTGRLWSELSRNSYGVYIIHVIVIGIFGTLLSEPEPSSRGEISPSDRLDLCGQ